MRNVLLHLIRSAGLASAYGLAVTTFFYALYIMATDVFGSTRSSIRFDYQAIPKPEEFGWLVGALAFVALLTLPRRRAGPWWAWGLVRAAAGTLAIALPVDALSRAASAVPPTWTYPLFWGPLLVGLLLTAHGAGGGARAGGSSISEEMDARASS